jgi:hypothetical protein
MYGLSNVGIHEFINPLAKFDLFEGLCLYVCLDSKGCFGFHDSLQNVNLLRGLSI